VKAQAYLSAANINCCEVISVGENGMQLPHRLILNERRQLTMTGVSEVVSFEEHTVVLRTQLGTLVIQGKDLQLKQLSVEGGQVAVDGTISALHYEEPRQAGGWFRRFVG